MESSKRSTCDCAERTGTLIVFTCPVCMGAAKDQIIKLLTNEGIIVRLDKEGSVSASIGSGGPIAKK